MVAGIGFYASADDTTALLDYLGEGRTSRLWAWPAVPLEPIALTRTQAARERAVVIESDEFGAPVVIHRDNPTLHSGTTTAVFARINFERLDPDPGVGLVDPDRSAVLVWQPGGASDKRLTLAEIGSQAHSMRAISPEYERWVTRVMGWVRRRGTRVWGLEQSDLRPDLTIDVSTVSAIYALPGALGLLEAGATGSGPRY